MGRYRIVRKIATLTALRRITAHFKEFERRAPAVKGFFCK
jgi:hypothetical protein